MLSCGFLSGPEISSHAGSTREDKERGKRGRECVRVVEERDEMGMPVFGN